MVIVMNSLISNISELLSLIHLVCCALCMKKYVRFYHNNSKWYDFYQKYQNLHDIPFLHEIGCK